MRSNSFGAAKGANSLGAMDQYIEIQRPIVSKDAEGGRVVIWSHHMNAFAAKNNLSGGEKSATAHGGQVAISRTLFSIVFQPGITEAMRVLHNSNYYNIKHVNNLFEKSKTIILTCESGADNG